jgi:hypothetical protein
MAGQHRVISLSENSAYNIINDVILLIAIPNNKFPLPEVIIVSPIFVTKSFGFDAFGPVSSRNPDSSPMLINTKYHENYCLDEEQSKIKSKNSERLWMIITLIVKNKTNSRQ